MPLMLIWISTDKYGHLFLRAPRAKWDLPCRGVLPAVSGQFVSHGLRTFAFEGSLTGLKAISGGAAELQVGLLSNPLTSSHSNWRHFYEASSVLQQHTTT